MWLQFLVHQIKFKFKFIFLSFGLKHKNMDNIELDDLGDRGEDRPPEDNREDQESMFDDDWRDESILDIDLSVREGLEAERRADRELGVGLGLKNRAYMEDKKNLLREVNINVNKGDGTSSKVPFRKVESNGEQEGQDQRCRV